MKKFLSVSLAAIAVIVSCQRNEQPIQENESMIHKSFTVAMPDSSAEPNSKTYLNTSDLAVYWSAGDEINVIARGTGNQYTFTIKDGEEGKASAIFEGAILAADAEETEFYAVYPNVNVAITKGVSIDKDVIEYLGSASGDHIKYFNNEEDPVKAIVSGFDARYAPMTAVLSGGVFNFRHGAAYFKLTVGVDDVQKVKLAASGSARFNGRPKYNNDGSTNTVESAKAFIFAQPEVGTFTKGSTYYIPVLTKQSSVGNLTITYTLSDGTTQSSVTTSSLSSTKLASGKIYDLKTPPIAFTPKIDASNVTIEADETGGTVSFTVTNLKAGGYVVKNVTSDGLSNSVWSDVSFNTTTGEGSVTFTCDENTDLEDPKTASLHLFYTLDGSTELAYVDVTVTQKKAVPAGTEVYYYYNTGTLTNTSGKFTEKGDQGYLTFDASTCGVSSFEIGGKTCTKGLKMNGSSSLEFTTSASVTASLTFYYACRKEADNSSARIKITPTSPAADATVYGSFNTFGTINSQTVVLNASTTYQIARDNKELALVYIELTETPNP